MPLPPSIAAPRRPFAEEEEEEEEYTKNIVGYIISHAIVVE